MTISNQEIKTRFVPDRRYNVVLYGVEECPSGSSRFSRLSSDLASVVSVFSAPDSTIQSHSIKECYRLGRFNPNNGINKPRPLLVRFVRMADVNCILSKRRNLSKPHFVKPDVTQEQRKIEIALLRERWNLFQSGVPRSQIKIHNACIYVKKTLHGKVINYIFKSVTNTNSLHDEREYQPSDATEPIPIVSHNDPNTHRSPLTFNSKISILCS